LKETRRDVAGCFVGGGGYFEKPASIPRVTAGGVPEKGSPQRAHPTMRKGGNTSNHAKKLQRRTTLPKDNLRPTEAFAKTKR